MKLFSKSQRLGILYFYSTDGASSKLRIQQGYSKNTTCRTFLGLFLSQMHNFKWLSFISFKENKLFYLKLVLFNKMRQNASDYEKMRTWKIVTYISNGCILMQSQCLEKFRFQFSSTIFDTLLTRANAPGLLIRKGLFIYILPLGHVARGLKASLPIPCSNQAHIVYFLSCFVHFRYKYLDGMYPQRYLKGTFEYAVPILGHFRTF